MCEEGSYMGSGCFVYVARCSGFYFSDLVMAIVLSIVLYVLRL